ncbi:MAG: hypothetical protein KKF57_12040 [Firmicutes bacterium]|nr:hypothetical protein [Bacillota bacterium]
MSSYRYVHSLSSTNGIQSGSTSLKIRFKSNNSSYSKNRARAASACSCLFSDVQSLGRSFSFK